jgi:hypothetical protein
VSIRRSRQHEISLFAMSTVNISADPSSMSRNAFAGNRKPVHFSIISPQVHKTALNETM